MKNIFFALFFASVVVGQEVERPKTPTDTTLASKTSQIAAWYKYAVYVEGLLAAEKAKNQNGSSDFENTVLAKLNNIEQTLKWSTRVIVTVKTNIALSWIDNSSNETGFMVERSTNGINFSTIVNLPANTTNYIDNGVDPGTYYYRVTAYNSAGVGSSTIVTIK
jgi:hypothetical protein